MRYAATRCTQTSLTEETTTGPAGIITNILHQPHDDIQKIEFERFLLQLSEAKKEYLVRSLV